MLAPPPGLTDEVLADALSRGWALTTAMMDYRAVGWGSHHWEVACPAGSRWFVTLDDLERRREDGESSVEPAYERLRSSLASAVALKDTGRTFVVAPIPTLEDQPLLRAGRFGVALYPLVDGQSFGWGEFSSPEHLRAMLSMLVEVHTAPLAAREQARPDDFSIPHRSQLEAALAGDVPDRGPYARPMAELIASHAEAVRGSLASYDALAARVRPGRAVLTHGEPHPGNTMRVAGGWRLIDWDTVLVAPPERDLWSLEPIHADYTAATGIGLLPEILELYRIRWTLADITVDVRRFRHDHAASPDDDKSWELLRRTVSDLTGG